MPRSTLDAVNATWVSRLVGELKGSVPGMVLLALNQADDGALAIGVLRIPVDSRAGWHGPRMLLSILAAADARGLDVVCTPTGSYGSDRQALVRALGRVGFVSVPEDPSGHTMRRPSPAPTVFDQRRDTA
ncbi:hypothetical protein [Salinispora vitiensis]|uniref:hypothetical protein n=1 Tax=Salinispora vitiensis TaxID=999544 RepID=UPI00035CE430|nr:hypothetical protein [Salinispora vitiensis]